MQRSRLLHEAQGKPLDVSSLTPMMQDLFSQKSRSAIFTPCPELPVSAFPDEGLAESSISGGIEGSVIDPWDDISRGSELDEASRRMASLPVKLRDVDNEDGSLILPSMRKPEKANLFQFPQHDLQDLGADKVMYERLQAALSEAKDSKREAYEEFLKRQKAEKRLNDTMQKVRSSITKEDFISQLYELHVLSV
ncbi:hypothetical protein GW17_00046047 [Ensete ventricosum]|nr:hypothetical protein GW17_00046047 [Ensete ventricosum]